MQRLVLVLALCGLAGCASTQSPSRPESNPAPVTGMATDPHRMLKDVLGMSRAPADLGYSEKTFNPCAYGMNSGLACSNRFFSVVHFQLLCRDSEGSVSQVPIHLQPIVADRVKWKVGGITGGTSTDSNGYGQFSVMSDRSTRGQRLILRIGPQFVSFTVSEVSKVILPKNFCNAG